MPLSSADVPSPTSKPRSRVSVVPASMPEPSVEPAPEVVEVAPTPPLTDLVPASESSDAGVQRLLAERQSALDSDNTTKAAEVTARLADLGFR